MPTINIPYKPRSYQTEAHRALDQYRFGCLVWHRRAGKTVAMVNQLIRAAWNCKRQRPRFAYLAPLYKQAKQVAWDYLKYFTAPIPGLKRNESELWIELPNQGRVTLYGADNPDSLRGIYLDGVVLDEPADMALNRVWGEVIRPTLADRRGWANFIGTPRGLDAFHDIYQLAVSDPRWFSQLLTVDDTGVLSKEELEAAKAEMTEAQFLQEFYCDWTASSDDIFIPLSIVRPALGGYMGKHCYEGAPVVLGYDVARFGDDASVGFMRQGLAAWEVLHVRGLDTMTLAGRIAQQINQYSPDAVFIDEGSMGAGVIDRLRQLGYTVIAVAYGGKATSSQGTYANKRAEMYGLLRQWLQDGGAIPQDSKLASQISQVRFKYDAANRIVLEQKKEMKLRGLASPDKADALVTTFAFPVVKKHESNVAVKRAVAGRVKQRRAAAGGYSVLDYR